MNRKLLLIVFGLVACSTPGEEEHGTQQLSGDYLGQQPPGNTARIFAPGLVSTEHGELNAVFSADLSEF